MRRCFGCSSLCAEHPCEASSSPHRLARLWSLSVVPTARRSHTTGPGRASMRPPRVSCQEVDPFAGGRSCCTWRGSCSKPLFRLSSWLERGCALENFLSLTNQVEHCRWGGHSKLFFSDSLFHSTYIAERPRIPAFEWYKCCQIGYPRKKIVHFHPAF